MAIPIKELEFCVVDTETTGGGALTDRVIDVAVFHVRGGEIQEKFSTLLNPGRPIPPWITALTGISDDMVRNAPTFEDVASPLLTLLNKGVFTAHNAGFDFGFIQAEFARSGMEFRSPQVCTLRLARQLLPELPSRSLGALCENLLIDISDRHRAHGDAEATVYVLKDLLRQLERHHHIHTWDDLEAFQSMGVLSLPTGIDLQAVFRIPETPGLYFLKDEGGEVVAKGNVKNLKRRIKTYFKKTNTSEKSNRLRQVVRTIETIPVS